MRTFRWTVPEFPLSSPELRARLLRGEPIPVTSADVKFFNKWKSTRESGFYKYLLRRFAVETLCLVVTLILYYLWLGAVMWKIFLPIILSSWIGLLLFGRSDWNSAEKRFVSLQKQIEK
jgi:hypothetical protein